MSREGKAGGEQLDLFAPPDGDDVDDRSVPELLNAYAREVAWQLDDAGVACDEWSVHEGEKASALLARVVPSDASKFLVWSERTGWGTGVGIGPARFLWWDYMQGSVVPPIGEVVRWALWVLEHEGDEKPRPRRGSREYGLRARLQMVAPAARASRCGTGRGYQTHLDLGEEPCGRCEAAFAELNGAGIVVQLRPRTK